MQSFRVQRYDPTSLEGPSERRGRVGTYKVWQVVSLVRDEAEIAHTFLGQGLNCSDCLLRAEHTVWKLRYFVAPPHVSQALDDADACRQ